MTVEGFVEPTYRELLDTAREALGAHEYARGIRIAERLTSEPGARAELTPEALDEARWIRAEGSAILLQAEFRRAVEAASLGDYSYAKHHVAQAVTYAAAISGGPVRDWNQWSEWLEPTARTDADARVSTRALGAVGNEPVSLEALDEFIERAIDESRRRRYGLEGPLAAIGQAAFGAHRPTAPTSGGERAERYLHYTRIVQDASGVPTD